MNNGKICVSVCAETAGELISQLKRAADLADIVEIRFDCLADGELETFLPALRDLRPRLKNEFLATFRPAEQGGKRELSKAARQDFWRSGIDEDVDWADLEFDLTESFF
jgi:3-dehydroquinate dehydratase type I